MYLSLFSLDLLLMFFYSATQVLPDSSLVISVLMSALKYSQRAIMKITRFIKLRSFSHGPVDLAVEYSHNPLKRQIQVPHPTHAFTTEWLDQFKVPLNLDEAREKA